MSQLDILKTELTTDPLGRGYSGMSDEAAADDLNTSYRERNRDTMPSHEVFNAIDKTELNALLATVQQQIWDVLHLGTVNPFGLEADLFVDAFGGGSATITALAAARKESITRATELGLPHIRPGMVEEARR